MPPSWKGRVKNERGARPAVAAAAPAAAAAAAAPAAAASASGASWRAFDVTFSKQGTLGLLFWQGREVLMVEALADSGLALGEPAIQPGCVVVAVQGESLRGLSYSDALAKMRTSARPLRLTFARLHRQQPAAEVADLMTSSHDSSLGAWGSSSGGTPESWGTEGEEFDENEPWTMDETGLNPELTTLGGSSAAGAAAGPGASHSRDDAADLREGANWEPVEAAGSESDSTSPSESPLPPLWGDSDGFLVDAWWGDDADMTQYDAEGLRHGTPKSGESENSSAQGASSSGSSSDEHSEDDRNSAKRYTWGAAASGACAVMTYGAHEATHTTRELSAEEEEVPEGEEEGLLGCFNLLGVNLYDTSIYSRVNTVVEKIDSGSSMLYQPHVLEPMGYCVLVALSVTVLLDLALVRNRNLFRSQF